MKKRTRCLLVLMPLTLNLPAFAAPQPIAVHTVAAQTRLQPITATAIGTLVSPNQATLASSIAGRITRIAVENGQNVAQGALIIQLDDSQQQAAVTKAQATYRTSKLDYQRKASLGHKQILSQAVIQQAQANMQEDHADLLLAQAQLKQTRITAPFLGRITEINVSLGDTVSANQALFQLINSRDLRVDYHLPSDNLSWLKLGQTVRVYSKLLPNKKLPATLNYIAPTVDINDRTVALQAKLTQNHPLLRPGLFVRVEQSQPNPQHTTTVPENAVHIVQGKSVVYTVVNNRVATVTVKTGRHQNGQVAVHPLPPNTAVIISSSTLALKNGDSVHIIQP
jgi:membrane fusion protein, multidrug efflux system